MDQEQPAKGARSEYDTTTMSSRKPSPKQPLNELWPGHGHIATARTAPFVIGQLGQSLDGRIATRTGASKWISGDAALDHVHRLRSAVDAVIIGANTALTDDPQLTVRRVDGRHPARVVIDPDGTVPLTARCFASDGMRRLVVRSKPAALPDGIECVPIERDGPLIAPQQIVAALHARGFKSMLVEGGAATLSAFLDSGALDRLHVLIAPVILGSGINGLSLAPISGLDEARRPKTDVHILDDGNVLFDCDLRS